MSVNGPSDLVKADQPRNPVQTQIASETANKVTFLAFGTVVGCEDEDKGGRLLVQSLAFPDGEEPCSYVSPVGGPGYGFFALPGLGATVLVGSVPFSEPANKYFWMGCLYDAGAARQDDLRTQPYYFGEKDAEGKQLTRTEVSEAPTTKIAQTGSTNPDAQEIYGSNDLPDTFLLKHPEGHKIALTSKKADVETSEIKIKTALNKRVWLNDSPAESGGDNILLIDENENQIRITNTGHGDYTDDSINVIANKNITTHSLEGDVTLSTEGGSKGNINLSNLGSGAIMLETMDGDITLKSPSKITLQCGGSTITLTSTGVTIDAATVNITGDAGDAVIMTKSLVAHTHIGNLGAPVSPPI